MDFTISDSWLLLCLTYNFLWESDLYKTAVLVGLFF